VAFSYDSTRLSDDSTAKIWDASSGACLQTLQGQMIEGLYQIENLVGFEI
jgi:hypothetical protein